MIFKYFKNRSVLYDCNVPRIGEHIILNTKKYKVIDIEHIYLQHKKSVDMHINIIVEYKENLSKKHIKSMTIDLNKKSI